jgi:hypothetical protein
MANNTPRVGNNYPNGVFIPTIWSQLLNSKYYAQTFLMNITNSKWEGEIKGKGSQVTIRNRPTVLITDGAVNENINYQDVTDESIELLINKVKRFAICRDDIDAIQQDIDALSELTLDASYQMKIAIETDVLGAVYADAAQALASVTLDKTNIIDWIIDAGVKLGKKNIPVRDRWLIIPHEAAGYLQKSDLKNTALTGDDTSVMRNNYDNGRLGTVAGFTLYVSNCLANAAGTYQCMAGHKDAITYASQIVKVEKLRLQDKFGDAVRGQNVYGYKTVLPDGLVSMPAVIS